MFGPGYILSWDLVTWLAEHRADVQPYMHDKEDWSISKMIESSGRAESSWVGINDEYMDHPSLPPSPWSRKFGPDVILVHGLKTYPLWADVLHYFLPQGTVGQGQY